MDLSARTHALVVAILAAAFVTFAAPTDAEAFCGFYVSGAEADLYNDATVVSLMRQDKRTVLSMQNSYEGPPEDFAMVVPVPVVLKKKQVKTLPDSVFKKLDTLTAPRMVEYWERDPCNNPPPRRKRSAMADSLGAQPSTMAEKSEDAEPKVKVEAKFKVGEYDVVVLSSTESTALEDWLNENEYNIPDGAAPYFKPYIENGQYFFVAKVDTEKLKFDDAGKAILSPLRFHYDTEDFALPVRLGLINSKGAQDLIAFIVANGQRYEVANYPNVTIPTNIVVNDEVKGNFGAFYNELFNNVLDENPKAVVTEYSWATSSCDPCPGPPLTHSDLMTLGADVLGGNDGGANEQPGPQPRSRRRVGPPPVVRSNWVVTRLHARYDKHTLGKDLVFKAAPPIVGGRGMPQGAEGTFAEKGSKEGGINNFQGRYINLHHWDGEVACENPQRGIWGGPNNQPDAGKADAAGDIAFDKSTSELALAKYVEEDTIAGLKHPVANYSEPIGAVVGQDGEATTGGGDSTDDEATDGETSDDETSDDDNSEDTDDDSASSTNRFPHQRGATPGGCASDSGTKEAGAAVLALFLLIGGVRRFR